MSGMDLKRTGISKSAQHLSVFHYMLNSPPVVMLVKEIACFLAIFHVHIKLQPILSDHDLGGKRGRKEPLLLRKALQFAYRHVVALKNAFGLKYGLQCFDNGRLPDVNAKRQGLNDQVIVEFVNNELRTPVGFAKNQPAILYVSQLLPVTPALLQFLQKKAIVDLFLLIVGQQPND